MKRLLEVAGAIERLEDAGYMQISSGEFRCGTCTAISKEKHCSVNNASVNLDKGCCNKYYSQSGAEDKKKWPESTTKEGTMNKLGFVVESTQRYMEDKEDDAVRKYISHIVNSDKKNYARAYWAWKQGGEEGAEPAHPNLGTMGAQAVRIAIANIVKGEGAWSLMSEPSREAVAQFRQTPSARRATDLNKILRGRQYKGVTGIADEKA